MEKSLTLNTPLHEEQELYLTTFGHSITEPGYKFGPAVRSYYLIHYITEGKGEFTVNHRTYQLSAGQGFLIEPDYLTYYVSDSESPWSYVWVGFSGKNVQKQLSSLGISQENPIFSSSEKEQILNCVLDMLKHNRSDIKDIYHNLGNLFHLFGIIADSAKEMPLEYDGNYYIEEAIRYIQNRVSEPLQVEDIANYLGLNRSYFSTYFKKQTGMSPLQYIQTFRLTKAEHMLVTTNLPVSSIAYSCGYQKTESLIKIFKKHYGIAPAKYRKQDKELTHQTRQRFVQDSPN